MANVAINGPIKDFTTSWCIFFTLFYFEAKVENSLRLFVLGIVK
jgi:hypothetical protein